MKKIGIVLFAAMLFVNVGEIKANLPKIQATFIVNFFRYVQWPIEEGKKVFTVAVYGKNHDITKELEARLTGQKYRYLTVKVIETKDLSVIGESEIVFIPKENTYLLRKAKETLAGKSVLIITEEQEFMPKGSIFNFKVVNSRLAFGVNEKDAVARKIQISSKLLAMAK